MGIQLPSLLESYLLSEMLCDNVKESQHYYIVNKDNIILPHKSIYIQSHKIVFQSSLKYAPYVSKVLAKYKCTSKRWASGTEFIIEDTEENLYEILVSIDDLFELAIKKYNRANRGAEQCHRT